MNQSRWIITNCELIGKIRKIKDNIAMIKHWDYNEDGITNCCYGCNEHISSRSTPGVTEIYTRYLMRKIVNRAKKIYSDIEDILEGFSKRKVKLQKIPNLLFIPKKLRMS